MTAKSPLAQVACCFALMAAKSGCGEVEPETDGDCVAYMVVSPWVWSIASIDEWAQYLTHARSWLCPSVAGD
jgi:hypothetical protein